jgi:SAM-dependent methyltransferase
MTLPLNRWVRHVVNFPALPGLIWKNVKHLCAPQKSISVPSRRSASTEALEAIYARSPDPWNYRNSTYEHEKYAATEAALPEPRYRRGFDVGCSIGVLTEKIAARCDQLLAIDVVEAALVEARKTCANVPNVTFERMRIPQEWPDGRFDLIMISEVLSLLNEEDILRTAAACGRSLEPKGTIVLVNYLNPKKRPPYADEAVRLFCTALARKCRPTFGQRKEEYRLDVLRALK